MKNCGNTTKYVFKIYIIIVRISRDALCVTTYIIEYAIWIIIGMTKYIAAGRDRNRTTNKLRWFLQSSFFETQNGQIIIVTRSCHRVRTRNYFICIIIL